MALVKVNDITVSYSGNIAIENASFNLNSGEYTCIVGENGSGKTTLVKAILGLVPLASGNIELLLDKKKISYLPQIRLTDPSFPATVDEIVLCGTQKSGKKIPRYTKEDRASAKKAMEALDILNLSGKRIGELSGGQQQRVMLARTLCRDPELLILDEPCSGLDPIMTKELYEILHRLNREKGVSVLMVSHDMEEVQKYASRIIAVGEKTVEYDGVPSGYSLNSTSVR